MRAPFSLNDAGELSRLLETAGLRDCTIRAETRNVRFVSPAMSVRSYIGGSPLAGIVATAPEEAYEELVSEIEQDLDSYTEQDSLCSRLKRISRLPCVIATSWPSTGR